MSKRNVPAISVKSYLMHLDNFAKILDPDEDRLVGYLTVEGQQSKLCSGHWIPSQES